MVANTPIDINLAKQLNILLETLGVPNDRVLIDPTTGSVGYGLEYCYSIMERIRQAALTQNDDKLQYPILNNIAEEVWKTKEAKLRPEENPQLGNPALRGVNLEAVTALSALQAGSDVLVLRHPKTLWHIRQYLSEIMIKTDLDSMGVDLALVAAAPQATAAIAQPAPTPTVAKQAPATELIPPPKALAEPLPEGPGELKETTESTVVDHEAVSASAAIPSRQEETETRALAKASIPSAKPRTTAGSERVELTDADIEAFRELLGAFRAIKNLVTAISDLVSGDAKHS